MSAVAEQPTAANEETPVESQTVVVADAEKTTDDIFKWHGWVHVGEGAQECPLAKATEHADYRVGQKVPPCNDDDHFHAWLRLPNPFQVRDITGKARAAEARKRRELRDPSSDASVILDDELEAIAALGEDAAGMLADEIVAREYGDINVRAIREADGLDDEEWTPGDSEDESDRPKKWALIDQEEEELHRQRALPEERRDDDFEALEQRVQSYYDEIGRIHREMEDRRRAEVANREVDELVKLVRRDRAEDQATEVYLHTYNTWQWFVCTFKWRGEGTPNERVWKDVNVMKYEAPTEVVYVLSTTFDALEQRLRSRRAGKGS